MFGQVKHPLPTFMQLIQFEFHNLFKHMMNDQDQFQFTRLNFKVIRFFWLGPAVRRNIIYVNHRPNTVKDLIG
jgi:hypothetical protein